MFSHGRGGSCAAGPDPPRRKIREPAGHRGLGTAGPPRPLPRRPELPGRDNPRRECGKDPGPGGSQGSGCPGVARIHTARSWTPQGSQGSRSSGVQGSPAQQGAQRSQEPRDPEDPKGLLNIPGSQGSTQASQGSRHSEGMSRSRIKPRGIPDLEDPPPPCPAHAAPSRPCPGRCQSGLPPSPPTLRCPRRPPARGPRGSRGCGSEPPALCLINDPPRGAQRARGGPGVPTCRSLGVSRARMDLVGFGAAPWVSPGAPGVVGTGISAPERLQRPMTGSGVKR